LVVADSDVTPQGYSERNFQLSMEMSFFGMPLYILDICPENRDESNGNNISRLWLQFIPIFGALHSQLRKGHTTKKDISMLLAIASFSGVIISFHTAERLMSCSQLEFQTEIEKREIIDENKS